MAHTGGRSQWHALIGGYGQQRRPKWHAPSGCYGQQCRPDGLSCSHRSSFHSPIRPYICSVLADAVAAGARAKVVGELQKKRGPSFVTLPLAIQSDPCRVARCALCCCRRPSQPVSIRNIKYLCVPVYACVRPSLSS